jgi:O-antigen ligase
MIAHAPPSLLARIDRWDLRHLALTAIVCIMFGGVFPTLVAMFGHAADATAWVLFWALLASFWSELPAGRLLAPAAPLLLWLLFYICWGVMAADYSIFDEGYRLAFRFVSIVAAMAVVTSSPGRLRVFAGAMQWVLVANLAVTVLLMVRPDLQSLPFLSSLNLDPESARFACMWGNANQAGLVALLVLVLSTWAPRAQAFLGRASGVAIIYLTASRTATWILVFLAVVYLAFLARPKVRLNALAAALVLALGAFFALKATGTSVERLVADNPTISRVLDVTEARTERAGDGSRRQVLMEWLRLVPAEPWYGYGLYTLYGGESDEAVPRPGFPVIGPHNLYVGILLDVGWVGLGAFLGIILLQLARIRRLRLVPRSRHALAAFCLIVLAFSAFNHDMLTDYAGWIAYSLMFLLPASPALAGQRLSPDRR